ncbi:hypothetical protein AX14_012063 [Amanita brunnescens Koide BX004]|nr:hypothetical protein AX14_012063 [Amanita brunnescens Koide BX004]
MSNVQQSIVDEQTVLLSDRHDSACQRTPLPKLQLAIVLLLQSCEIVMGTSIMPYINQLIEDLGIAGVVVNRAEGFALLPLAFSLGSSVGPALGGGLARPYERFPEYFKDDFWREYPYFLSCLGPAIIGSISFLITLFFFKETLPKRRVLFHSASSSTIIRPEERSEPMTLRKLLTYPVILSISNYATLAFLEIMFISLLPLFMAMPIELGGLGFTPMAIGYILGTVGIWMGLFSVLFLARLLRRFGERRLFIVAILAFSVDFVMLPLINIVARQTGVTWIVWCLLAFSLSLLPIMVMGYSCIFIFITASSPNKYSLGATNGMSQTTVSIARAIGPALATSLFSFSVDRNVLGGYAVYLILFSLSCAALLPVLQLPVKPWDHNDNHSQ